MRLALYSFETIPLWRRALLLRGRVVLLVLCLVAAISAPVAGAVTFFVNPDGQMAGASPTRDLAFQQALSLPFQEFDFSQFTSGYIFETQPPTLQAGTVYIRPRVLNVGGGDVADPSLNGNRLVEVFPIPAVPEICELQSLLNRVPVPGGNAVGAAIAFTFSAPVQGFGVWIMDDFVLPTRFVLKVTEFGGATTISPALNAGNDGQLVVEGFLGAVSTVGITGIIVEQQTLAGSPTNADFFYLDHMQVGGRMPPENCQNGVDDNGDGLADCLDPTCHDNPAHPACGETMCDDGKDNDGDGKPDCADQDCFGTAACTVETLWCADGADNDGDGLVDCADSDCGYDAACPENCGNGVDDNHNGAVDCEDLQCMSSPSCPSVCAGIDPDAIGLSCVDYGCSGLAPCAGANAPLFFVQPDGQLAGADPARDLAFQAAMTGPFTEIDFHEHGHGYIFRPSPLQAGGVSVEPFLLDGNGNPAADLQMNGGRLIETFPFVPSIPGIIGGGAGGSALLNRVFSGAGPDAIGAGIEFTFSQPVEAFGVWVMDDAIEANRFVLKVTEAGGTTTASTPMDSGNGTTLAIEGFLGAVSRVGITKAVVEQQTLAGTPSNADFFYLDHVQVGMPFPPRPICRDPFADVDGDGDVDMDDFGAVQLCFGLPGPPLGSCGCMDRDADGDVDGADFAAFQACASGAGVPAAPDCD